MVNTPFSTNSSLLLQVRRLDQDAWVRFTKLYGPLVYSWCRQKGLHPEETRDVVQDVFRCVSQAISSYQHESLRGWLWTITQNQIATLKRKPTSPDIAVGGSDAHVRLEQLPAFDDSSSDSHEKTSRAYLLGHALELIRPDFSEQTWQAFWQLAVENRNSREIAADLNMTDVAVRHAKFRVLNRLKEELGRL